MSTLRVYRAGRRFRRLINVGLGAIYLILLISYFLYRNLLVMRYPYFVGVPMAIIFLLLALLLTILMGKMAGGLQEAIRYEITEDTLIVSSGKNKRLYPWKNFRRVQYLSHRVWDICPVSFDVAGENLTINQYVDHLDELVLAILQHLEAGVEIDEEVRQRWGQ